MRKNWTKRVVTLGTAASLLILAGCNSSTAPVAQQPSAQAEAQPAEASAQTTGETFRIGYLPATIDLLFFVAQEEGYFAEEGLKTELIEFGNSGEGLNAIKAGKLDVGAFGTAAPLSFIDKGASDMTIIGGAGGKGNGIIALPDRASEFQDIQGFVGKKIATVKLANGDAVWRKGLADAGIDWKNDVEIVELDKPASVLQAVKNKSVDAGVVWAPFMEMAEQQGLEVVSYTDEYFEGHPCCRQVALNDNILKRKGDYEAFFRALIRAEKFYHENKEETIDIVTRYVKVDRALIEADAYGGTMLISADPNKKGVEEFWEGMKKIEYVQSQEGIENNINVALYEEALNALLKQSPEDAFLKELEQKFKEDNL
ncbi:ABC transporter substrate-binding protein [Ammoniphilus sp. CFH 90114]|uniref:ABC transporter substrate-binding protein n=1 Tax=Ammoniphilus sp. CFH 90114 TaxID=2493665 RepID=UPI00100F93DC|nr:ABC transporter substrate-binding protein [Ammoniphilus sp. CFH 90114]RXT08001.1 metal ABC transporter substrate-binding protein [Ammoniphilus sp. CFH 90114]